MTVMSPSSTNHRAAGSVTVVDKSDETAAVAIAAASDVSMAHPEPLVHPSDAVNAPFVTSSVCVKFGSHS